MKKNGKMVKFPGLTYEVHTPKKTKKNYDPVVAMVCVVIAIAIIGITAWLTSIGTKNYLISTAKLYINEDTAYVDFNGEVHEYDYTPITGRYMK